MVNLSKIFRFFFKKGSNSVIKVISLGVGLAMGLVLIAKVYFEQSYDDFFPDKERIYMVQPIYETLEGKNNKPYHMISGGVVVGMTEMIPEVEVGTRFTTIEGTGVFFTTDRKKIQSKPVLADTCLFEIFPRPILAGNPKEVLGRPMYAMISRKLAEHIGGVQQSMGQTIVFDNYPGRTITIGGVFEDLPLNSHMNYDLILSMNSISNFMGDGSLGWMGNERYSAYVKVVPGSDPLNWEKSIQAVKEKYLPLDYMKEIGLSIDYFFSPLLQVHAGADYVKRMNLMLGLLAFALLFTAIMNYVLIVISSLVSRSKEMAVYKCYGSSEKNIINRMLLETFIDLLISLLLATLLILVFRGTIQSLLNTNIGALFTGKSMIILAAVCVLVFLVSGLIPGYLFGRVPVATAFRNYTENRRFWKLGLLFIQFIAAGLFITMLFFIARQYDYMINEDPGYKYENLAYCSLSGINADMRRKAMDEVSRLSDVSDVTTCSALPLESLGGNNIYLPDRQGDLFNIADFGWVGNDYHKIMEIPVIDGRPFTENVPTSDEMMVSRSFIDKLAPYMDLSDGIIGKSIMISQHSQGNKAFTICGVYEEFQIGAGYDTRPSIMMYATEPASDLIIKFHKASPEALEKVSDVLKSLLPDKDIVVLSYAAEMVSQYRDSKQFRDQVMLGGIITLVICLIGLIGYTNDEMSRRRKEMAIRKVNGATIMNIQRLFITDISRMALPALFLGSIGSYFVIKRWLEGYPDKIPLSPFIFLLCIVIVWFVIIAAVIINCYKAATENPAKSVKSE